MTTVDSTVRSRPSKPAKPNPEYPLYAHAAGYWAKKIRGKVHYFGKWDEPDAALDNYLKQKDSLHAGRTPRQEADATTMKQLANAFLEAKQAKVDSGERSPRTWYELKCACDLLVATFGKSRLVVDLGPPDFSRLRKKMTDRWGFYRVGNMIQCVRSVFAFGLKNGLLVTPVCFGEFDRPSKKVLRGHRNSQPKKMLEPADLRRLIDAAGIHMRAMLLLAINAGFGNADCATLKLAALDLERGWMAHPRPKTEVERRCPLWPETVAALRESLAHRPTPKAGTDADLFFITKFGTSWDKTGNGKNHANPVGAEAKKLFKELGLYREGQGFYVLRHVFRTIADECPDRPAIDCIMGHVDPSMGALYREKIADARLLTVANHVRSWLYQPESAAS